jgi:hypothetical protein
VSPRQAAEFVGCGFTVGAASRREARGRRNRGVRPLLQFSNRPATGPCDQLTAGASPDIPFDHLMKIPHRHATLRSRGSIAALVTFGCVLGFGLTSRLLAAQPAAAVPLTAQQIPQFAQQNKLSADQVKILEADLAVITADQAKLAADQQKVAEFKATMSPDPKQRKPNELMISKLQRDVLLDQSILKTDQAKMVAQQVKWTLPAK